jgi:hypothetical protein
VRKLSTIALIAASIFLSGCASLQADFNKLGQAITFVTTATVSPAVAQVSVSSFQVLEAGSTGYFKYCKTTPADAACAPGTVTNPGPLRLAIKYIRQGRSARDQIKLAGRSGALISSTVYHLLTDAITNLSSSPVANFGAAK